MIQISGTSPIRIFWASAAEPFQHLVDYKGQRTAAALSATLDQFRAMPGGWACAIIHTHTHKLGTEMARDCETNETCFWDGTI